MGSGERSDDLFKSEAEEPLEFEAIQHAPPPSPRGTLRMAVLLGGLVIAGVALWFVVGERQGTPVAQGELPVVRAPEEPVKVRPEQPGGMEVPHRDKLVYERLGPEATDPKAERLLPEPEEPMARPEPAPEPSPAPAAQAPDESAETPSEALEELNAPPPAPVKPTAEAPEPAAPAPERTSQADADTTGGAATGEKTASAEDWEKLMAGMETAAGRPATEPVEPEPAATPESKQPEAAKATETASAPADADGGYRVQVAALRSRGEVEKEWSRLQGKHGDLLGPLSLDVEKADLGAKGVFYRLRAGPLADRAAAGTLCDELKKRKQGCMVVSPDG